MTAMLLLACSLLTPAWAADPPPATPADASVPDDGDAADGEDGEAEVETKPVKVKVEGLPFKVTIPLDEEGAPTWDFVTEEEPGGFIDLFRPMHTPPLFHLAWQPGLQPDMDHLDTEILRSILADADIEERIDLSGLQFSRTDSEKFGPMIVGKTTFELEGAPPTAYQVAVFPVEAGTAMVSGLALAEDAEVLDAAMAEVLDIVFVLKPPEEASAFRTGHVVMEAGYELDLPTGWRTASRAELKQAGLFERVDDGPYDGAYSEQIFADPADMTGARSFFCTAKVTPGNPAEVIEPRKSEIHVRNFMTRSRVMLKESSYTVAAGKVEFHRPDLRDGPAVKIEKEAVGTLEWLPLGEREAYRWKVDGAQAEVPVTAMTFYTSYDNIGLDCGAFSRRDDTALLDVFTKVTDSLRVSDGMNHPMKLSLQSRYHRWWPYTHPLKQLYLGIIPLFLVAFWLVNRD